MEVDTLNKIEELVREANRVEVVTAPGEPSHVYYLRTGTKVERMEAGPPVIAHVASTLETLADKAADTILPDAEEDGETNKQAQIWVDRSGVVLLLDGERRDRVRFDLSLSEQMCKLMNLGSLNIGQKDLILLLRTTFRECLTLAGDLISILRTVKFNATEQGEQTIQHGRASLGKALTAEITGTQNLPEYVMFSVPVFAQAGVQSVRANVECALEPDAATKTFKLIPLPGQIERAVGSGESQVAAAMGGLLAERKATAVSVFRGKP